MSSLVGYDLARSYGEGELRTRALRGVSVELEASQITLLMGPSGSGKSTLLAVLAGLLRPDEGRVVALDQDLYALSDRQRERFRQQYCGFVFQGHNLFQSLTARQQLEMSLSWGGGVPLRQARLRTAEMLDLLGLQTRADLFPEELSGGEKQRVALGRALLKHPAFFFVDEPTSALDWENGRHVIELLADAARTEKATVFVVSHDHRVVPYADRVLSLEDGRLTEGETLHVPAGRAGR